MQTLAFSEDFNLERDVPAGETKQFYLHIARLPTGTVVDIHIFIHRGIEPGPVLLLSGGLHGDEVNGTEIVRRVIDSPHLAPVKGTLISIPVLNIYGFLNFARDLPDGKDANRSFPGTKNGSLASRVAYNLTKKILPIIDFGVDFHTGGASRSNFPQIRCDFSNEKGFEMAKIFSPPFILHSPLINNSLRNEAFTQSKSIIVYEGGQSLRFDDYSIVEGFRGVERLMINLGMIPDIPELPKAEPPKILHKTTWVRAETAGLFHSFIDSGRYVNENELIGMINAPYNNYEVHVHSASAGYVIGMNHWPVVNAGDALFHIGY